MKKRILFAAVVALALGLFLSCHMGTEDAVYVDKGTYTIYYKTQMAEEPGKYEDAQVISEFVVEKPVDIETFKKEFEGFTVEDLTVDSSTFTVYIYYNRISVEYTFNTGAKGAFADGETTKKVTGLYGSSVKVGGSTGVEIPASETAVFRGWDGGFDGTFGLEAKTFNAKWIDEVVDGFSFINSGSVTVACGSEGGPFFNASSAAPVTVNEFYMAQTEVTYSEWNEVYKWAVANGYSFANLGREGNDGVDGEEPTEGNSEPVAYVNWRDVVVWCNAASEKCGRTPVYYLKGTEGEGFKDSSRVLRKAEDFSDKEGSSSTSYVAGYSQGSAEHAVVNPAANGYRLPTEAEWEFAARGADPAAADWSYKYAGSNDADAVAWYTKHDGTHNVGTKAANAKKLYDMCGNVFEWCWDPRPASERIFVCRGGCWDDDTASCVLERRAVIQPNQYLVYIGFRVAYSLVD